MSGGALRLSQEVAQLIRETEGYEDALSYVDEIAADCEATRHEVITELKIQLRMEWVEDRGDSE